MEVRRLLVGAAPLLAGVLSGWQDPAPRPETGTLTGVVAYEGIPPRPDLVEPNGPEGASLDESLLVAESGEMVNVVAFVEVAGAPKWRREKAQVSLANNRAVPRILFVSPGAEVEFKNGHDFGASFISDFGAFKVPPGGSRQRTLQGPGSSGPMRWYAG